MTDAELGALAGRLTEPWHVVGPPWGDGTYVVSGDADPHFGRFICDTLHADDDGGGPGAVWRAGEVAQTRADARELLAEVRRLRGHVETQAGLVRELYGVIADLHADDPGRQVLLERGRAEGRGQAAELAERFAKGWPLRHPTGHHDLCRLSPSIRALGDCRPPLPPSEAEREAVRLRGQLLAVLVVLEGMPASERYAGELTSMRYNLIAAVRESLGASQ